MPPKQQLLLSMEAAMQANAERKRKRERWVADQSSRFEEAFEAAKAAAIEDGLPPEVEGELRAKLSRVLHTECPRCVEQKQEERQALVQVKDSPVAQYGVERHKCTFYCNPCGKMFSGSRYEDIVDHVIGNPHDLGLKAFGFTWKWQYAPGYEQREKQRKERADQQRDAKGAKSQLDKDKQKTLSH